MGTLKVYLLETFAGTLSCRKQCFTFQYDPDYLRAPQAKPLSYSLPLQSEAFSGDRVRHFFENLLPPESVRKRMGKILHLSRHNTFGFLAAIGGECAGSISLYASDADHTLRTAPRHLVLPDAKALEILHSLSRNPLYAAQQEGYRISGAGAQDKLIACLIDGRIALPLYGTPSTHIFKPGSAAYPESVHNEAFCMALAAAVGIPAAPAHIIEPEGEAVYCVERYDRARDGSGVVRLHQEDFCQLLGADPEQKYEIEGGPGVSQCLQQLRRMRLGAPAQLDFIRRILFNVLILNADAHAKNYSILYHDTRAALAPAYDLLCTALYPELSPDGAMKLGDTFNLQHVTRAGLSLLAQSCAIRPALLLDELDKLIRKLTHCLPLLETSFQARHPSSCYKQISQLIRAQLIRLSP